MKNFFIALIFSVLILPFGDIDASYLAEQNAEQNTVKNTSQSVVILDPPLNFTHVATKLGYHIGGEFQLDEISIMAVTVFLPDGRKIETVISELTRHFPDIVIADNDI